MIKSCDWPVCPSLLLGETIYATAKLVIVSGLPTITNAFPVSTLVSRTQSVMYGPTDGQYEFIHIYVDKPAEGWCTPVLMSEYEAACPHAYPLISYITNYHTAVDIRGK